MQSFLIMKAIRARTDAIDEYLEEQRRLTKEAKESPLQFGQVKLGAAQKQTSMSAVQAAHTGDLAFENFVGVVRDYITSWLYGKRVLRRNEVYDLDPADAVCHTSMILAQQNSNVLFLAHTGRGVPVSQSQL